jgi:hypothetical protein
LFVLPTPKGEDDADRRKVEPAANQVLKRAPNCRRGTSHEAYSLLIWLNPFETATPGVQFIETEPGAIDQARVATLIGTFGATGLAICIARLDPVGPYVDASYEIPVSQLKESEVDLFQQALKPVEPVCKLRRLQQARSRT